MTIKLRNLRNDDYSVIKMLFDDVDAIYQWPWYKQSNMMEENKESSEPVIIDFEPEVYTKRQFNKDLESKGKSQLYVIEKNGQIIGYIQLDDYKITSWGMINPNNMEDNSVVLESLMKKYKKLRISTLFNHDFFINYGFKVEWNCFLYWE